MSNALIIFVGSFNLYTKKMNNVKKSFSIRDMENLSGIKAHTIRIWEKRYKLFTPERTSTNIRTYGLSSLQKLLNITLLYKNGYKISRIAQFEDSKIPALVREITSNNSRKDHATNALKLAMVNFDQTLFQNTYNGLLVDRSFREIFHEVFIPLLNELGLLWQTDAISPAHEHFISHLIKQKIHSNTEKLQMLGPTRKNKVFALFLPENEIHEIGLLYLNYEILLQGYKSIYLGQTMSLQNLGDLQKHYDNIHFVSYFTVAPTKDGLNTYFDEFSRAVNATDNWQLWILGHQTQFVVEDLIPDTIKTFTSIKQFVESLV